MVDDGIYIDASPLKGLGENFDKLRASVSDLRPLFEQFAADFYKDSKRHFRLSGPGKYTDLSPEYARRKQAKWGFEYPILVASGRLSSSLMARGAVDSICVIGKDHFIIGTSTPYAVYHHSEMPIKKQQSRSEQKPKAHRRVIPRRPLWFFGETNAPMRDRWYRLITVYLDKATEDAFK